MENARDSFVVRQMLVKEERISQALGADNDFYEVIPGYLANVREQKDQAKQP